jgi:RNA polymerase sigma factor (TIGR02999 family)
MAAVTELLDQWRNGDLDAFNDAVEFLYQDLRKAATGCLARSPRASVEPTALLHEAYLRLAGRIPGPLRDRKHFLTLAAKVMRNVLVDRMRQFSAQKRRSDEPVVVLDENLPAAKAGLGAEDFLMLDEALTRLAREHAEWVQVIEMRYFGGLDLTETAEALGVSIATVTRRQRVAEAWLHRELSTVTRPSQ